MEKPLQNFHEIPEEFAIRHSRKDIHIDRKIFKIAYGKKLS